MCTYINSYDTWHTTDHPVICYKVMFKTKNRGKDYYKSIYYGDNFKRKDVPLEAADYKGDHTPLSLSISHTVSKYTYMITKQGVHAFMTKADAADFIRANKNCFNGYREQLVIVECVIPLGTLSIIGKDCYAFTENDAEPVGLENICAKKMIIKKEINEKI